MSNAVVTVYCYAIHMDIVEIDPVHVTVTVPVMAAIGNSIAPTLPFTTVLASPMSANGGAYSNLAVTAQRYVTVSADVIGATCGPYTTQGAGDGSTLTSPPSTTVGVVGRIYKPNISVAVNILPPPLIATGAIPTTTHSSVTDTPAMAGGVKFMQMNPVRVLYHMIYQAQYSEVPTRINKVYAVGKDYWGNPVFASAENATNISEYGEFTDPFIETAITSSEDAETIASVVLSKYRLSETLGQITIPPNIGIEIGDVVSVTDTGANQADRHYRVLGYSFEYTPANNIPTFAHAITLTGV